MFMLSLFLKSVSICWWNNKLIKKIEYYIMPVPFCYWHFIFDYYLTIICISLIYVCMLRDDAIKHFDWLIWLIDIELLTGYSSSSSSATTGNIGGGAEIICLHELSNAPTSFSGTKSYVHGVEYEFVPFSTGAPFSTGFHMAATVSSTMTCLVLCGRLLQRELPSSCFLVETSIL